MNITTSDMQPGNWIDKLVPAIMRPYLRLARLDRPTGIWLLLFPCWWSVALASKGFPDLWFFALFGVGSLIVRGAGCTFNDYVDRNIDAKVARTSTRPLASKAVGTKQALLFFCIQLLVGLLILLQFNAITILLGIASVALILIYPFVKRFTYWPQAFLGLTLNWGALIGWTAVRGDLSMPAIMLYTAGFFWTLGYDTIYAHQDKEDDLRVGIKSTALKLSDTTQFWLCCFYMATISFLVGAGLLANIAWPYFLILILGGAHLAWQALRVDIDNAKDCLAKFKSNRDFAGIVLAAIIIAQIVAAQ